MRKRSAAVILTILFTVLFSLAINGAIHNTSDNDGADAYWLTVDSFPVIGVEIEVSTEDTAGHENGTTHFTRSYIDGTVVTLTAPETVNGESFLKWVVDGEESEDNSVTITISEHHIARVEYSTPPGTYPLVVRSFPITAVNVTVTPNDYYGSGSGFTYFTNTYTAWTNVTLTAPALINGRNFVKWDVHGIDNFSRTVTVTMSGYRSLVAVYDLEPETYKLEVKTFPAAGVNI
ncbi:MAG: hypothetical protein GY940_13380, partial [bacterium]|nr:hypothetical protein [bacterium]